MKLPIILKELAKKQYEVVMMPVAQKEEKLEEPEELIGLDSHMWDLVCLELLNSKEKHIKSLGILLSLKRKK